MRTKAFVLDVTLLPIDRIAADTRTTPEKRTPRHEHAGTHRSVRAAALDLAGPARLDPRPDRRAPIRGHRARAAVVTAVLIRHHASA